MQWFCVINLIWRVLLSRYFILLQNHRQLMSSIKNPTETVDRKFNVKGMFCESCKKKIETAVSKLPGVVNVNVDQTSNEMIVTYDTANENIKQTLSIVNSLGYTTGLKSSSEKLQVLDF